MININNLADCCGCTACASICNHGAITMQPDALGFLYPFTDMDKCKNCGLCERVCAFNNHYDIASNFSKPIAYGARHTNIDEVMLSRSGGAFATLCEFVLDNNGVVYGVGFFDHFYVLHKRVTNKSGVNELRGSKYVQSDLTGILNMVKQDLKNGLLVLFSGTACQTAGLNSYIGGKLRKNLILVDIVCHGVPSPKLWADYISYIEKKYRTSILTANFRDKSDIGWKGHKESFILKGIQEKIYRTTWTHLFYKNIMLRPSCGSCHFCNLKRPSDITLADFWGSEKQNPEANKDNKGLSLVLCNTQKGLEIFKNVSNKMYIFETSPDIYLQANLQTPSILNPLSEKFANDYSKHGFEYVVNKYSDSILKKIYKLLKREFKRYTKIK